MYPNYNYFPQNQQPIRQQPPMYGQEIIDITNKIFSKIKNNRG